MNTTASEDEPVSLVPPAQLLVFKCKTGQHTATTTASAASDTEWIHTLPDSLSSFPNLKLNVSNLLYGQTM